MNLYLNAICGFIQSIQLYMYKSICDMNAAPGLAWEVVFIMLLKALGSLCLASPKPI